MFLLFILIAVGVVYSEKSIKRLEDALNAASLKFTGEFILEIDGTKGNPYFCYFAKDASTSGVIKIEDGPSSSTSVGNKKYKLNLSKVKNGDALYGLKSDSSAKWNENIINNYPDNPDVFVKVLDELKRSMKFKNKVNNTISEAIDIDFDDDNVMFTFRDYCGSTPPKYDFHITVSLEEDNFGAIISYEESEALTALSAYECDKDDNCLEKMEKFTDAFVNYVQGSIKMIFIILGVVFGIVILVVIAVVVFKYKKKSKF